MNLMGVIGYIKRQITEIRRGGKVVVAKKLLGRLRMAIAYPLAILPVLLIRFIRPLILIRFGSLNSDVFGTFAQCTEIHLCERDAHINQPACRFFDVWVLGASISNKQLALMWRRCFLVWPYWLIEPLISVNRMIPGGARHEVNRNTARDTHNLFDRFPAHLKFDSDEELFGQAELRKIGIEEGGKFVCILARDTAFKEAIAPNKDWSYQDYRNMDVSNYILAAEELAKRGFYVLRMGSVVKEPFKVNNPKIIDYATSGLRSDFMDIYLAAKCEFCITMGSGWDSLPFVFRKPIVYVNLVPLGFLNTFSSRYLGITKRHWSINDNRELTLSEIFARGVGYCLTTSDYQSKSIDLIENTPEEVRDVAIEMVERLNGTWQSNDADEDLQRRFWSIFPTTAINPYAGSNLHGEIRSRFGAAFLRNNRDWVR